MNRLSRSVQSAIPARFSSTVLSQLLKLGRSCAKWILLAAFAGMAWSIASAQSVQFAGAVSTLGGGFSFSSGVAVDGSGNIYVADTYNNAVKEMLPGCASASCVSTLGGGFSYPTGVAVDGSGNIYIADRENNAVKEMPAGCASASCVTTLGGGFNRPADVAVDGSGNIYVADTYNNAVKEMLPGCASASCVSTLGGGFSYPAGVAVDTSENVYIADGNAVKEMPSSCASASCVTVLGGGFYAPSGVAVDGSGNVYVDDEFTNEVNKMPPGCASASCVTTLGGGFNYPEGVAVDGSGNVYVADSSNSAVKELMLGAVNFGSVAVGTTSTTQALYFTISSGTTVGNISVMTMGITGLDYADAGSSTCTAQTYTSNTNCVVNVKFTPAYPGTRLGAVEFFDGSSNSLATVYLTGTGTGPMTVFYPSASALVNSGYELVGSGYDYDVGIAVDGNGNVYTVNTGNNSVLKETLSGGSYTQSTVGSGLNEPYGVAVDGAGNVYIADTYNNRVLKETLSGLSYTQSTVGSGLSLPGGVAVDGAGNVYICDELNNRVLKAPITDLTCATAGDCTSVGSGLSNAGGVAVDGSGNVYIADTGNSRVLKETVSGSSYTQSVIATKNGDGLNSPVGIAVDGSGNVYVADTYNNRVLMETLAGGSYTQSTLIYGLDRPGGVAVDGSGNVYIANTLDDAALKLNISSPPSLSFASTAVGSTSSDSPQTVTVWNLGNEALTFPIPSSGNNPSISTNFTLSSSGSTACPLISSTASSPGTLALGTSCTLPISFTPTIVGSLSGSLVLTDNNLNGTNAAQTISLSGTATGGPVGTTTTLSSSVNPSTYGQSVTITATVAQASGGTVPTGTVQFSVDGSDAGSAVTLSGGTATYTTSGLATGTHSITAVYIPATGSGFIASSATALSQNVLPSPAFTVTTIADDATAVAANCTDQALSGSTPDANCSLRDAIAAATAAYTSGVTPTVNFASALTSSGPATITWGSGPPVIADVSMDIIGPGPSLLTVSGAGLYTVFPIVGTTSTTVSISGLTITQGSSVYGGAISNLIGTLSLNNVAITNSTATYGGGIHNGGTLTLTNSTVSGNTATAGGGGIADAVTATKTVLIVGGFCLGVLTNMNTASTTVVDSTIANNTSPGGLGGGILVEGVADQTIGSGSCPGGGGGTNTTTYTGTLPYLSVLNSTITGNSASSGGGIYNGNTNIIGYTNAFSVVNGTITGNTAATGGGIDWAASSLALQNDIDTGNTATTAGPDMNGTITDGGGNLLGLSSGTGTSASANLAPLGNYGGPTQTMPVLPSSPAFCTTESSTAPGTTTTDQRGVTRPTQYSSYYCSDSGATNSDYSIAWTAQPTGSILAGATLNPVPAVQFEDDGFALPATGTIQFNDADASLKNNPVNVTLSSSGSASLSGGSFTTAATGDSLQALYTLNISTNIPTLFSASSSLFNVVTCNHFTLTIEPANVTAGTSFNVTVTAYSSTDNSAVATVYTGPIVFTSTDPKAVFPTGPLNLTAGVGTFSITLKTAGTETITVADSSGSPISMSSNIAVSAATASMVIANSGSGQSAIIGAAFTNPLTVQVVDAFSNPISGNLVTFTPPASGASASLSTSTCTTSSTSPVGTCSVTATANGTASATAYTVSANATGVSSPASFSLTNNKASPTLTVTASPTTLVYGQPVSIQAASSITSISGSSPTGAVTFYDNATALTPTSTPVSGVSTFSTIALVGSQTYAAAEASDSNFNAAAESYATVITVGKANSTLTGPTTQPALLPSNSAGSVPVSITGQYSGTGVSAPSGSVGYAITPSAGGGSVASGSAAISSGTANVPVASTLAAGSYNIAVTYSGDGNYTAATGITVTLQVEQITQSISFSPATPVTYGVSPITLTATGGGSGNAVTFSVISGPGTISGSTLTVTGAGTIVVAANQAGNTNYLAAAQVSKSIVVNQATPTISLMTSANPVLAQSAVTFTATVLSTAGTPTGTVSFLDGTASLGSATLNSSGVASFTTSALSVAVHSITAVYSGDTNFISDTSSTISETLLDFNLAISGSSGSTSIPGGTAVYTFTLSPVGSTTFLAAVTLSVSGLPSGTTVTFSPATVAAGSGAANVTLTIQLPQTVAAVQPPHGTPDKLPSRLAPFALALLLLPIAGRMRKADTRFSRMLSVLLLSIAGLASLAGLSGCSSMTGFYGQQQTSYTLTVTATSGSLSHSTTVGLTVEKNG